MPTGLKRYQQSKHFHFITFSCYKRQPFLHTAAAKDTVLQILEQTRRQQRLCIAAYVLMPEHVHLLTDEPAKDTLATFLQILKQLTSRQLKSPDQKQFWQRRYYDFNVSSHERYVEKLQYIHRNPVKRGLRRMSASGLHPTLRKSAKDGAPGKSRWQEGTMLQETSLR
jgi:putative transposase